MGNGIVRPVITIGFTEDRKLTIVGPLEDKPACIMMLSDAIKMVVAHQPKEKSAIVVPEEKKVVVSGGIA